MITVYMYESMHSLWGACSDVEVHSVKGLVTSVLAHSSCPSFSDLPLVVFPASSAPRAVPLLIAGRARHQPGHGRLRAEPALTLQ